MRLTTRCRFGSIVPALALAGLVVPNSVLAQAGSVGGVQPGATTQPDPAQPTIPEHDLAAERDLGDGLIVVDLKEGTGDELVENSLATVQYTGWLKATGAMFDTSKQEGRGAFSTPIPGRLIEGWNKGMIGMKEGGVRKLIIPAALGYGERAMGSIPANSDLIFVVELENVLSRPVIDESAATRAEDGALWVDLEEGEGAPFEQGGFGTFHITLWDGEGKFVGSSRVGGQAMMTRPDDERYWVSYAHGMKTGGVRGIEMDDPRPASPEQSEEEPAEKPRWNMIVEAIEVHEPILPTPHDESAVVELDNGLKYVDLKVGEGEELPKDAIAIIRYSAWLENGRLFDSTEMPGAVEEQFVSPGLVIKGWEEGIKGMRVGGVRKLILPPDLAFGETGAPQMGVPGNATVIYEVELLRYEMPLFIPIEEGEDIFGDWGDDGDEEGHDHDHDH